MSLSFIRGLVAAVNPCGFILLPTYLMYFLGLQGGMPGTQRATLRRALLVSAAVSAGFLVGHRKALREAIARLKLKLDERIELGALPPTDS